MALPRIFTLIAALLALVALTALPAAAGARSAPRVAATDCHIEMPADAGAAGDASDDEYMTGDTATDDVATSSSAGPDDQGEFVDADGNGIDDSTENAAPIDCEDLGKGVQADFPDEIPFYDISDGETGFDYYLPSAGQVSTTLMAQSGLPLVRGHKVRVLSRGRKKAGKAGTITVALDFNRDARRALRRVKRAFTVKVKSHVVLADGTVVDDTKTIKILAP